MNIIYFSPTGNTRKVIKTIVGQFVEYNEIDITLPRLRNNEIRLDNEITFVAVPVYAGRVPKVILPVLNSLNGNKRPCVVVVTYGNRSYDDALLELKDIMTKRNFNVLAAAAFVCEHSYSKLVGENRPSPDDLIEYHEFGECISNIRDGGRELEIPGSRPYCVHNNLKPMCPEVGESCIKCGHCEKICPSGAISLKETIEIDKTKCLKCQSCVKKCPTKSLSFNGQLDNFTLWLETNCTERIENEIFTL